MPRATGPEPRNGSAVPACPINAEAAVLLEELADALQGEQPCPARKIAAYRRAAAATRTTPLCLDELWRAGRDRAITRIPGVTSAIARVIGDLIATKRVPLHQEQRISYDPTR